MEVFETPVHTYILTCYIPSEHRTYIPSAVSLVEHECDHATNVLRVKYSLPKDGAKENYAISIKCIDYPYQDFSFYLIEYIELAKFMGVHKRFIYKYDVHPNMSKVLRYSENQNQVKVIPMTIPGTRSNIHGIIYEIVKTDTIEKLMYERIPHNDCFYNNIYKNNY
ncbi:unnamed protein product [Meganyctiphanes norvegica]|uniref:Glycosyltransferase family 92 protein n=1 Tax=Meganyctiphanes norvegica TaxID=48144 RepID=A0AAV2R396_MEGNR